METELEKSLKTAFCRRKGEYGRQVGASVLLAAGTGLHAVVPSAQGMLIRPLAVDMDERVGELAADEVMALRERLRALLGEVCP